MGKPRNRRRAKADRSAAEFDRVNRPLVKLSCYDDCWARCFIPHLGTAMKTAEIIHTYGTQAVKLPDGFQFEGDTVTIRREREAVILEPLKPATWLAGFFDRIRIDDPAFARPEQGHAGPISCRSS